MEQNHIDYSIQQSLRHEFETAHKFRAIEIYKTSLALGFDEQALEMRSDLEAEFNIKL